MFKYDSPVFRLISKIADIIILNFLWILCSIPIFTIGASTTALYYVCMKLVKNEEGYIIKDFFHSFKENFKQSTIITLIYGVITAFFALDIRLLSITGEMTSVQSILRIIFFVALGILFCLAEYTFPMLAKFDNTIKNTIKNAFIMAFIDLKKFISVTFMNLVVILLMVLTPNTFLKILFVCVVVGISGPAYVNAYTFNRLFEKYAPQKANSQEEEEGFDPTSIDLEKLNAEVNVETESIVENDLD